MVILPECAINDNQLKLVIGTKDAVLWINLLPRGGWTLVEACTNNLPSHGGCTLDFNSDSMLLFALLLNLAV